MRKTSIIIATFFLLSTFSIFVGCDSPDNTKDCVVMLGDSIFALSGDEAAFLEDLSGTSYRKYYESGAMMVGGFVPSIPEQYQQAVKDGPVRTVILDGAGNDVLIGGQMQCSTLYGTPLSSACMDIIDKVSAATETMLLQMAADGVKNIIWQGYYKTTNPYLWQVSDVTTDRFINGLQEFQAAFPDINVIFVDVRPYFNKYNAWQYTIYDGIHPTTATSEKLANLVWDTMVANDIEQGTTCTP